MMLEVAEREWPGNLVAEHNATNIPLESLLAKALTIR